MLRVRATWSGIQGAPYLSTFYFDAVTENTASAQAAATKVRNFIGAHAAHIRTGTTVTVESQVAQMTNLGVLVGTFATTTSLFSGAAAGDPLPPATQALYRWHTGSFFGGREIVGRTFIPALTEADSTAGVPTAALITDMNSASAGLMAVTDPRFCVWSERAGGVSPVTSAPVWSQFAVLRSRRD